MAFSPATVIPSVNEPSRAPLSRPITQLPLAVLVLGLLITAGITVQNILFNRRYHEQAEIALLDDLGVALVTRINAFSATVAGISAMAESYASISPELFRRYVEGLRSARQLPEGILNLAYARYVAPADRASYEAGMAAIYGRPVQIRTAGIRSGYASVTVLDPMRHSDSQTIGYDLLSDPIHRDALIQAARSRNPVLSGKHALRQNPWNDARTGSVLYSVIHRDRSVLPSAGEHWGTQVWGWASISFPIEDLMKVTLQGINNPNLQGSTVLLFDGDRPSRIGLLYDPTDSFGSPRLTDPNYVRITVGGRSWLVGVQLTRALPGPDGLHPAQGVILLVGSLISVLAAMVSRELLLSHRRTLDALHQVSEAAEDLAVAAAVFEGTVEGVVITNPDGLVLSLNQSFTQLTGYTTIDLRSQSLSVLRSGKHDPGFYRDLWDTLRKQGRWHHQIWNQCKDGSVRLHDVSITTVTDKRLKPLHYVAMYRDITSRYAKEQEILHQATHDHLTGLANRSLLVDRLEQALVMGQRYGYRVGLMFMDLDGFKAVNDSYGHDVGDALLIAVSRRLESLLRKSDTLCRQGGDEFVLLLPQAVDRAGLMELAKRIQAAVSKPYTCIHGIEVLHIAVSIGIACWPEHGADVDALMQAADRAMYRCKQSESPEPVIAEPVVGPSAR